MKGSGAQRNQQIEGLRGLAILVIVFFHLVYRYHVLYQGDMEMQQKVILLSRGGDLGVLIFLIISVWFLYSERESGIRMAAALKGRYRKLWPGYAVSVTITFLLSGTGYLPGRNVGVKTYLINLTLLEGFLPGIDYVDGAHWYLTTLFVITFWMLLIGVRWKGSRWPYLAWLLLCAVSQFLPKPFSEGGKLLASDYVGVVVFVVGAKRIGREHAGRAWKEYVADFMTLFLALAYMAAAKDLFYGGMMCACLGAFVLCYQGKLRFLDNPVFTYTGKISYPLFLIHQNVSYMIENFLTERLGEYRMIYVLPAFAVSYGLAMGIYMVEKCLLPEAIK